MAVKCRWLKPMKRILGNHYGDIAWCECDCHTKGTPQPVCEKCYSISNQCLEDKIDKIAKQSLMLYWLNFGEKKAMTKAMKYYFLKLKEMKCNFLKPMKRERND